MNTPEELLPKPSAERAGGSVERGLPASDVIFTREKLTKAGGSETVGTVVPFRRPDLPATKSTTETVVPVTRAQEVTRTPAAVAVEPSGYTDGSNNLRSLIGRESKKKVIPGVNASADASPVLRMDPVRPEEVAALEDTVRNLQRTVLKGLAPTG